MSKIFARSVTLVALEESVEINEYASYVLIEVGICSL